MVSGGLGLIIPLHIFINYGLNLNLLLRFAAGILPGILIAICIMGYTYFHFKKHGEDKEKISANYKQLKARGFFGVLKDGFWALLCPVIILGSIYTGICTPTEAAALSVIYALLVSIYGYHMIKWNEVWSYTLESLRSIAPLCLLIAMATALGRILL